MKLGVVRTALATSDTAAVYDYLADVDVARADRFVSALDAELERLAGLPGTGRLRTFNDPKLAGLRSRGVSGFDKYLIFYRYDAAELLFLRLIHGSRDLERLLLG